MNRQQRRQAERQAKKGGIKFDVAEKFVVTVAVSNTTKDVRIQCSKQPVMDMFSLMKDATVCEAMAEQYLHRDGDLSQLEAFHFTNWCAGLKSAREQGKYDGHIVTEVRGYSTFAEAQRMVAQLQQQFNK